MNKSHGLFKWLFSPLGIIIAGISSICYAAQTDNSGQQALQQLKLLQQRLAPAANIGNKPQQGGQNQTNAPANVNNKQSTPSEAQNPPDTAAQLSVNDASQGQNKSNVPAEIAPISDQELIDDNAFNGVTRQLFPLTPERVIELRQMYDTAQFAEQSPSGTPPKPTATSQFVNLSPGSTPPVIRLAQGFVSSLVFLDSTGAPWPISAYDLGDPTSFNIQWDHSGNTLMIQAMKLYNYGNLAVKLKGLNTPVMLTLIPGQKAVDYRVDLRVQGYGPNSAALPLEEGIPPNASDVLLHVLEGVPPQGSQHLTVTGGDARAWLFGDKIFVRTNLTILSPGWIASMTSADGMHAYEMQKSPVLLVSWHGKVMQLKVEGL